MKTLWFIPMMLFLWLPEATQAQPYPVDRGNWIVGGSASFTSHGQDNNDERTTSAFLGPRGQYFVLPGLAVGGIVSLSYTTQENLSTTGLGVGPTVTYYFGRGTRSLYPFVSASASIRRLSSTFDGAGPNPNATLDATTTSRTFDVSGGVVLMIAKNVGLTSEVFYQQRDVDADDDLIDGLGSDAFGLRLGLAAFVF